MKLIERDNWSKREIAREIRIGGKGITVDFGEGSMDFRDFLRELTYVKIAPVIKRS